MNTKSIAFILLAILASASFAIELPIDIKIQNARLKLVRAMDKGPGGCKEIFQPLLDIVLRADGITQKQWDNYHSQHPEEKAKLDQLINECKVGVADNFKMKRVVKMWFKARVAVSEYCDAQLAETLDAALAKNEVSKTTFAAWKQKNANLYKQYSKKLKKKFCKQPYNPKKKKSKKSKYKYDKSTL